MHTICALIHVAGHPRLPLSLLRCAAVAELMSTELAALVGESYERAYTDMVSLGGSSDDG